MTSFLTKTRNKLRIAKSLRKTKLVNYGYGRLNKDIIGIGNKIFISENTHFSNLKIRIRGENNVLEIGENCAFGPDCSIWMEGNNISINIGKECTFTTRCHINAQENGSKITIGDDCMFSNHIIVRTSDSHPIYDLTTNERINMPRPIIIGNHVWIAPNTKIMKGSNIANGCIIGSDSTITKTFETNNSLIVGRPAKIVKQNVYWTRESLF